MTRSDRQSDAIDGALVRRFGVWCLTQITRHGELVVVTYTPTLHPLDRLERAGRSLRSAEERLARFRDRGFSDPALAMVQRTVERCRQEWREASALVERLSPCRGGWRLSIGEAT